MEVGSKSSFRKARAGVRPRINRLEECLADCAVFSHELHAVLGECTVVSAELMALEAIAKAAKPDRPRQRIEAADQLRSVLEVATMLVAIASSRLRSREDEEAVDVALDASAVRVDELRALVRSVTLRTRRDDGYAGPVDDDDAKKKPASAVSTEDDTRAPSTSNGEGAALECVCAGEHSARPDCEFAATGTGVAT